MIGMDHDELPQGRDEEAAAWCMQLAEGDFAPEQRDVFDRWVEDPANRAAFEDAIAVWHGLDHLSEKPEFIRIRTEALDGYRGANRKRWFRRFSDEWQRPVAAMAAVLLVAIVSVFLLLRDPVQLYETGIGERRVAILSDGSRLSLDSATRIEVRFTDNRRDLTLLGGRAKFDVAKNPFRPFSVMVAGRIVVATGTSFSIELLTKDTRVILYEGNVEVLRKASQAKGLPVGLASAAADVTRLTPGHELIASNSAATATIVPADVPRALSWETGQLTFEDEPLASAVERVNRYSPTRISVADPSAADARISGVFTIGDTEAFLEAVTILAPVSVQRAPGRISLQSYRNEKKNEGTIVPAIG